jgi:glutathionyl-hydroquinone reductase
MGMMVEGVWRQDDGFPADSSGRFIRPAAPLRNWITPDGAPGPSGHGGFAAEPGRYHLYVSLACPWAHRTLIFRALKGLQGAIGLSVVHWHMGAEGWTFEPGPGVIADPFHNAQRLYQVYAKSDPAYTGRVTVPVLWDCKTGQIVNNESSEIIRMLNSAFDGVGALPGDYYPADLRGDIDALNARIYDTVNNGVYRAGFARSQAAYDEAVAALFESLDWLDEQLSGKRFLLGDRLTEADWRLFTT